MSLEWTRANHLAGRAEGWWMYKDPGNNNKQWLSHGEEFRDIIAVHKHIIERAASGSPLHVKILAILYVLNKPYFLRILKALPDSRTDTLAKTVILMARMS